MMTAEAFASIDMAPILALIFLRSRSTRERLPRASDRLPPAWPWMAMTMAKKLVSVTGTRCAMRSTASAQRKSDRRRLDDLAELGSHRLLTFVGGDADRVSERQSGLHAAHDDIDGAREIGDEFRGPAMAKPAERVSRQADAGDHRDQPGEQQDCRTRPRPQGRRRGAATTLPTTNCRRRYRKARLLDAAAATRRAGGWPSRDRGGRRRSACGACPCRPWRSLRAFCPAGRRTAARRFSARVSPITKRAIAATAEAQAPADVERVVHRERLPLPSRRGPRPAAAPRRTRAPAPRTAGGRSPSSGAGP